MVVPTGRPPQANCAPCADIVPETTLKAAGIFPPGALVRLRTERSTRRWAVIGATYQQVGGLLVLTSYRLQSTSFVGGFQVQTHDVAPELVEPEQTDPVRGSIGLSSIAPSELSFVGGIVTEVRFPTGVDVPSQTSQTVREELTKAECDPDFKQEPAAQTGGQKSAAPDPIVWVHTAPNTRCSNDGRFHVLAWNGPWFSASDAWTGEVATRLETEAAALQWCRNRTDAPPLDWKGYGSVSVARTDDGLAFSVAMSPTRTNNVAVDDRFASVEFRCSPVFSSFTTAKRWAEIRACCVLDAKKPGGLQYVGPVPF